MRFEARTYSGGFAIDPAALRGARLMDIKHAPTCMTICYEFHRQVQQWPWYARAFAWLFRHRIREAVATAAREPFMETQP